jgi:hypothetical protein
MRARRKALSLLSKMRWCVITASQMEAVVVVKLGNKLA